MVAEVSYEVAAFIRNPMPELLTHENAQKIIHNHITRFAEALELSERRRMELMPNCLPIMDYTEHCGTLLAKRVRMNEATKGGYQEIRKMNASDLGGERAYIADFEVYDERSVDHNNVTVDIYIGIRK